MEEQIKRIVDETDHPETKIEKTVTINFDGHQFFVRIPMKISEYLSLDKKNRLKFTIDIPFLEETGKKMMVVEIVDSKK
jgi:hypothetical protein